MGAMKAKMFGVPPVPDPVNARVESGDPNVLKKSMGYKMNALRRRTEQQLLVSMGARAKRSDEVGLYTNFKRFESRVYHAALTLFHALPCSYRRS